MNLKKDNMENKEIRAISKTKEINQEGIQVQILIQEMDEKQNIIRQVYVTKKIELEKLLTVLYEILEEDKYEGKKS